MFFKAAWFGRIVRANIAAGAKIDTILTLDDKGTGITNGFIREGWQPPTYPMYGFLCWQVRLVDETDATAARLEGKP